MNSREESKYRYDLAVGYLREAEEAFAARHWWTTIGNAQVAIENAAKAVVALFEPVEKIHDPDKQLTDILTRSQLPKTIQKRIIVLTGFFPKHGKAEHIKATYGEDKTHTPPWNLFNKREARNALTDARKSVRNAQVIIEHYVRLRSVEGFEGDCDA